MRLPFLSNWLKWMSSSCTAAYSFTGTLTSPKLMDPDQIARAMPSRYPANVRGMRTRLTDVLQIEHPVMLAGMGGVSYAPLVIAVSEAGGFGTLGAGAMTNDQMLAEMRAVHAATDKPWGVDLLTAMP